MITTKYLTKKAKTSQAVAVKDIGDLAKSFGQTTGDLDSSDIELVAWAGVDRLKKIVERGQSAIIIGNDEAGKSCACAMAESDLDDVIVIAYPDNIGDIYLALWQAAGMPLPRLSSGFLKTENRTRNNYQGLVLRCSLCPRSCQMHKNPEPFFRLPEDDDIRDNIPLDGRCKLISDMVDDNMGKLRGQTVVIRIPDASDDATSLLDRLLEYSKVVIMANPEQARKLRERSRFRRLPTYRFPRPEPEFFGQLVKTRMEYAGVGALPLNDNALGIIYGLCERSPGNFVHMMTRVLDQMEFDEISTQVGGDYILPMLEETTVEVKDMVKLAVIQLSGSEWVWVEVGDINRTIKEMFGEDISAESIGRVMKTFGFEHKYRPKASYHIPPLTPAMLTTKGLKELKV